LTPGIALFCGALLFLGVLGIWQWSLGRHARAHIGQPVPELPGALGQATRGDILLWFHSPHCGPCRAMRPKIAELVQSGAAIEVDVSDNLEIAQAFGVMATPTTIRIRQGHIEQVSTGSLSPRALESMAG